jgi:hypothetical protein
MASDQPQPSPGRPWWKLRWWYALFRRNQPVPDPPPPLPPRQQQQPVWVPDQVWQPQPMQQRNNALLDSMPSFVPPPEPAKARDEEIKASFQEVLRCQAELNASIERLRSAFTASPPEIVPDHNQGLALIEELDVEDKRLLALLLDKGPRPAPADRVLIIEQAEKTLGVSEKIQGLLKDAAVAVAKIGAREVIRNLTAPLWADVAQKIVAYYHAIKLWLDLLM